MATKENIFPNDTFTVMFEGRKPDLTTLSDSYGLPATIVSGTARLYDSLAGLFVEIGGTGITTLPVTVAAPSGTLRSDRGSIVTFTLPQAFTALPNTYTLYITMIFDDGNVRTEDIKLKVNEFK